MSTNSAHAASSRGSRSRSTKLRRVVGSMHCPSLASYAEVEKSFTGLPIYLDPHRLVGTSLPRFQDGPQRGGQTDSTLRSSALERACHFPALPCLSFP